MSEQELKALVARLVDVDPLVYAGGAYWCLWCQADEDAPHEEGCAWVAGRKAAGFPAEERHA